MSPLVLGHQPEPGWLPSALPSLPVTLWPRCYARMGPDDQSSLGSQVGTEPEPRASHQPDQLTLVPRAWSLQPLRVTQSIGGASGLQDRSHRLHVPIPGSASWPLMWVEVCRWPEEGRWGRVFLHWEQCMQSPRWDSVYRCGCFLGNSFIEIEFTYHTFYLKCPSQYFAV